MTISSQVRKAGPFTGNGSASAFPFAFKVFSTADVYVVKLDESTEVETVLALTTDYTVSLNADQNANPGGTVTLVAGALESGYKLTVTSSITPLQATDLTNQGGFYPAVITNALDKLTILIQQVLERLGRSLTLPLSASSSVSTELPLPSANKLIQWNGAADGLQNADPTSLATIVAFGTANADTFSGDGATTVFALSANPGALNNLDVSISGVTQTPENDYTWVSGTNITFTSAPPAGTDNILVRYMQALPQGYADDINVNSDDGSSGSKWLTVAGFISYIKTHASALFSRADFLSGAATNLLIRDQSAGATRIHVEPNGIVSSGTASKLDMMLDPYESDSNNYRILGLFTNNGDTWGKGWPGVICVNSKSVGNFYGAFPPIVFGFNDLTSSAGGAMKVMFVDKTDNTIYSPHKGAWRSGMSVTTNDYAIYASGSGLPDYVLYKATTTGTTGATPPTHLTGTASDGGVTWQFIKNYTTVAQAGNFLSMVLFGQRDDIPAAGSLSYNVQFARGAAWQDGQHAAHLTSAGAVAGYRSNVGSDLYDYFSGGTHLMRYTSTFRQHQGGATLAATKTNTDNSTVLDASLCDTLIMSNTSPTNVSTVVSTVNQFFFVRATNANTTLVHSGSLYLKGAVNRTMASGEVAFFYAGSSNAAREIGA